MQKARESEKEGEEDRSKIKKKVMHAMHISYIYICMCNQEIRGDHFQADGDVKNLETKETLI